MKISIINYGAGNIFSIFQIVKSINKDTQVTYDKDIISKSDCIILPGVGSFNQAVRFLKEKNIFELIKEKGNQNNKIIGICLGMQLMMSAGNEDGYVDGLNFFKGECVKIKNNNNFKVPNTGLREVKFGNNIKPLKKFNNNKFYHMHSYKIKIEKKFVAGWSHCDDKKFTIPAVINNKNIYGFQFHPEKSGKNGIIFFKEILKILN